jgi:hypothetical protein
MKGVILFLREPIYPFYHRQPSVKIPGSKWRGKLSLYKREITDANVLIEGSFYENSVLVSNKRFIKLSFI